MQPYAPERQAADQSLRAGEGGRGAGCTELMQLFGDAFARRLWHPLE
jgi:hypothetical protein